MNVILMAIGLLEDDIVDNYFTAICGIKNSDSWENYKVADYQLCCVIGVDNAELYFCDFDFVEFLKTLGTKI